MASPNKGVETMGGREEHPVFQSISSSPELFVVMELPFSACHMSPCSREKPPM